MKLKTATLLAITGSAILIATRSYYLYKNIKALRGNYDVIIEHVLAGVLGVIGSILILIFFITLYKNQKK